MSWEVPEGRHYLAGRPRWWYWERWGSRAGNTGQTKQKLTQMLKQGNDMSQYETGYGAGAGAATATADYSGHRGSRNSGPVVSFDNVTKVYGRLRAVDGLTLDPRAGDTA